MGSSQSRRIEPYAELFKLLLLLLPVFFFLLSIMYIWDKLEENNDEFYPDELNKCPKETYPLDNSEGVRCISCPRCPSGMEPTPPCGTTLAVKLKGECVPCRTGTYSNNANSDACRACTDCGSRETLISCTTERDAKCRKCPWFHFEDHMTNTCKHCDFCCGRYSSARFECVTSKMCNITCAHTSIKRKFTYNIFKRKISKANNSRGRISGLVSQWKDENKPVNSVKKEDNRVTKNEEENREHQIDSKSTRHEGLEDIEDIQLPNFVIPDTIDKNSYFQVGQDNTKKAFPENIHDFVSGIDQRKGLSISTTLKPIVQFPTGKGRQFVVTTRPTQPPTPPSPQHSPRLINLSLYLSNLMGSLTVCAFLGLVLLVRKCIHKRRGDLKRLQNENSLEEPDIEDSTQGYVESYCSQHKSCMSPKDPENRRIVVKSDLNLAHLPLDLQDILMKKLDVRCKRQRFYGWKKVGEAFQIPIDDLRYLELEYQRDTGSPTLQLLEILGRTKKKTIDDLVTVLEGPDLRRPDITAIIMLT